MSFDIGAIVAGKYRVERVLRRGGMGTVLLATHTLLDRPVALKILHSYPIEDPAATERLLREGRALARLRGEHIARVLDVEASENGPCFLVLEYLEGEDLGAMIRRLGKLPVDVAVTYIIEACEALAEAHAHGIVHRDIKPSNLFLSTLTNGSRGIKVIDFGISKLVDQSSALTHSRSVIGSPCYMAPEQLRSSERIDARCDIWSLGVVFYEVLTGRPPHAGNSVLELCASILESAPKSPRTLRPEVSQSLDAVVRKCLALDPDERYASVEELARSIAPHCDWNTARLAWNLPTGFDVLGPSPSPKATATEGMSSSATQRTATDAVSPARRMRHSFPTLWIFGMLLVALAFSLVLVTHRKHIAVAATANLVGSVTEIQQEKQVPTIESIVQPTPHSESQRLGVGTTPAALLDAGLPPSQVRRNLALPRATVQKPQVADSNSALMPRSQSTATANSIEQDPVLQYGHY